MARDLVAPPYWTRDTLDRDPGRVLASLADADRDSLEQSATARTGSMRELNPEIDVGAVSGGMFQAIREEIHNGLGFFVLRNFPTPHDREIIERLLLQVAQQFGTVCPQDADGTCFRRVRDSGHLFVGNNRGSDTSEAIGFHTDGRDVAVLLCLSPAQGGGDTSVVGLRAVYEEMQKTAPELTELLFERWHFDRRVVTGPLTMQSPILSCLDRKLSVYYLPHLVRSAQSKTGSRLDAKHSAAIDLLDHTCARTDLRFDVRLQVGDMLFLNNYTTLHARTAFQDGGTGAPRELIRVWIDRYERPALATGFKYGRETIENSPYG